MNRIKNFIFFVILVSGFTSCIEFFRPDLEGANKKKYVVDGQITDQEGFQEVYVSVTSSLDRPIVNPLQFCKVKIIDDLGNEFKLDELKKGKYSVWMSKDQLVPERSYRVDVITPTGLEIISDFDQLSECPEIDSIYYKRKDIPTTDLFRTIQAIQFYVDFDRKNTNSHYYKWEIDETWEHHSVYPITWYAKGTKYFFPPNYTRFFCWTTERVKDIFTLSTENINQNRYTGNPVHIVDNQSQRLSFCYSALIYQYSLSKMAYEYWDKLRMNNNEQGGLYNTQPLRIKGNLKCTTNPDIEVLGFFSASSIKSKRIIVQNVENLEISEPTCLPPRLPTILDEWEYMIEINGKKYIIENACVECDYISGTTVKPNYWPKF